VYTLSTATGLSRLGGDRLPLGVLLHDLRVRGRTSPAPRLLPRPLTPAVALGACTRGCDFDRSRRGCADSSRLRTLPRLRERTLCRPSAGRGGCADSSRLRTLPRLRERTLCRPSAILNVADFFFVFNGCFKGTN